MKLLLYLNHGNLPTEMIYRIGNIPQENAALVLIAGLGESLTVTITVSIVQERRWIKMRGFFT